MSEFQNIHSQLDAEAIGQVRSMDRTGEPAWSFLRELLGVFEELAPKTIDELAEAVARQDLKAVEHFAHKLRGMARNVGAKHLSESGRILELASKNNEPASPDTVSRIRTEYETALAALYEMIGSTNGKKKSERRLNAKGLRVLVVEDNRINQGLVGRMLTKLEITFDIVDNGEAAVRKVVNQEVYDLILMDCQMQGMDGFEATRTIRALTLKGANTPIVAMTASSVEEAGEACQKAGMNDHLSKPLKFGELESVIRKFSGL